MRKTSHDGIDATSITSSIENEIKKAGTNISKIKRSSIKRKVQNFSHESDDGIIEPLLQIDKEKSEIANRSAKYLLNKSKTDSYEKGNKSSENYTDKGSISTVVSPTSKIVNNTEKENQISPSYTHGTAPIHNHMNTNIFGTYDVPKGIITTKSSILVEIDGCKPSVYTPNPLIFTTAKIHTDGKTKLMEPLHVTPVPILSTIEGNVVKTVANTVNENNLNNFPTKPVDLLTNVCSTSETIELQSLKQTLVSTTENTVVPKAESLTTNLNENQSVSKKEPHMSITKDSRFTKSTHSQNLTNLTNNISNNSCLPTITTSSINVQTTNIKVELSNESSTSLKSTQSQIMNTKPVTSTSRAVLNTTASSTKKIFTDKTKDNNINEKKGFTTKVPLPLDLQKSPKEIGQMKESVKLGNNITSIHVGSQKQEIKSKILKSSESEQSDAKDMINRSKISATGSKKLQRQKNAALEEVADTSSKAAFSSVVDTKTDKISDLGKESVKNNDKAVSNKGDCKTTISTCSVITPLASTIPKSTVALVPESVSKLKTSEATNLTSLCKSGVEDISKPLNITSIATNVHTVKDTFKVTPSTSSIKSQLKTTGGKKTTSSKPDVELSSSQVVLTSKTDIQGKSDSPVTTTTLPAYIVSTSKTKIGSTLTSNTITNTTKTQIQKPKIEIVYNPTEASKVKTPAQQSDKPTVGSSSNGTNKSNFSQQPKTKPEKNKEDGRA